MTDYNLILITLSSLVVVLAVVGALRYFSRTLTRRWNKHKAETVDRWAAEGIDFVLGPTAGQFGGLESMGLHRVVRGIGYVALTPTDLRVTCATPTQSWIVPLKQIKGVALESSFMGKRAKKVPFIVVRFISNGNADRLAFQVNEVDAWAKKLARAAKVRLNQKSS